MRIELGKRIGLGAYGSVYLNLLNPDIVIKVVDDNDVAKEEVSVLRRLRNQPGVVNYLGHYLYDTKLCMMFHRYDVNLTMLMKQYQVDRRDKEFIMYQLCEALEHIHARNVIHHDIKMDNILVYKDNLQVVLCDFGLSRIVVEEKTIVEYECYTLWYRPIELVSHMEEIKYERKEMDNWAMACVFAEMVLGKPLFYGSADEKSLLENIQAFYLSEEEEDKENNFLHGHYVKIRNCLREYWGNERFKLFMTLLDVDPCKRDLQAFKLA